MRRNLVMHAPHGAALVAESDVQLHHRWIQALLEELITTPRPAKISPVVLDLSEPNDVGPVQSRFSEFHFYAEKRFCNFLTAVSGFKISRPIFIRPALSSLEVLSG